MVLTVDGTKLIVAQTDSKIAAVEVSDGKVVWEAPFVAQRMNYNASTPIVEGQTLIYGGGGRGERAVKFEKSGDHLTAKELWANPDESVQFNSPVLVNGVVYGLTQDNKFFALDAASGHTDWTAPAGGQAAAGGRGGRGGRSRGGYGSIVAAGSVLIALTPSGEVIVMEPNDKKYTELARIKVADSPTYAYPIVSENRIYIKDQTSLALWTVE